MRTITLICFNDSTNLPASMHKKTAKCNGQVDTFLEWNMESILKFKSIYNCIFWIKKPKSL